MAFTNQEAAAVDRLTRFFLKIPHQYTQDLPTSGEALQACTLLNGKAMRTGCAGVDAPTIFAHWPAEVPVLMPPAPQWTIPVPELKP